MQLNYKTTRLEMI